MGGVVTVAIEQSEGRREKRRSEARGNGGSYSKGID